MQIVLVVSGVLNILLRLLILVVITDYVKLI